LADAVGVHYAVHLVCLRYNLQQHPAVSKSDISKLQVMCLPRVCTPM
jgi:hypothetical protein